MNPRTKIGCDNAMQPRVLIATDHEGIARLLRALLPEQDALPVVSIADAVARVLEDPPDVSVADVLALECLGDLRRLAAVSPVVAVSSLPPEVALVPCLDTGVRGFLWQPVKSETLDEAVRVVAGGGTFLDARSAEWLTLRTATTAVGPTWNSRLAEARATLSQKQAEVIGLTHLGVTVTQIATRLGVSPNTVKTHLRRAREKLAAHVTTELRPQESDLYSELVEESAGAGESRDEATDDDFD